MNRTFNACVYANCSIVAARFIMADSRPHVAHTAYKAICGHKVVRKKKVRKLNEKASMKKTKNDCGILSKSLLTKQF